jgi:hypothetical protein
VRAHECRRTAGTERVEAAEREEPLGHSVAGAILVCYGPAA